MKIYACCPNCGDTNFIRREDGFECAACEEFVYPEDMSLKTEDEMEDDI